MISNLYPGELNTKDLCVRLEAGHCPYLYRAIDILGSSSSSSESFGALTVLMQCSFLLVTLEGTQQAHTGWVVTLSRNEFQARVHEDMVGRELMRCRLGCLLVGSINAMLCYEAGGW